MQNYWDRLKSLMDAKGLDITAMAAALDVSYQAIAKVKRGGELGSANNIKAARLFGVRPEWLATGAGPRQAQVLILDESTVEAIPLGDIRMPVQERQFWARLQDSALSPQLRAGDDVLIDQDLKADPGDLVLLQTPAGMLLVRRYVEALPGVWSVEAINPAYMPLEGSTHGLRVIGVVVSERRNGRRSAA